MKSSTPNSSKFNNGYCLQILFAYHIDIWPLTFAYAEIDDISVELSKATKQNKLMT